MKIEFQGGEPTLRADLVREIMERATRRFDQFEFAICTNLMNLTPEPKTSSPIQVKITAYNDCSCSLLMSLPHMIGHHRAS